MGLIHPLTVDNETKTVSGWIFDGGEKEDDGYYPFWDRSARHFHNPLLAFNEAGLNRFLQHYQSSILWAQDGVEQAKMTEGDMSWQKVKEFYYHALISDTEEKRHLNFGLMFKGLGHQMHLVQDMGNPEHTRNDNHPITTMERWVEKHNQDVIKGFCESPIFPDVDLQTLVFDLSTQKNLIPISRLSDADVYGLTNPIPSTARQQGLAEYSNANFLSDDTVFSSDFPFPRSSGLDKQFPKVVADYVADEKGLYASRNIGGEGEAIDHFVRVVYLQKNLWNIGAENLYYRTYSLDATCYNDYASKLIPRSVGYSAALVDYFFRGEIEITLPYSTNPVPPQLDGIYGFTTDGNLGFRYISLMAKNITKNSEEMTNGLVSLIVSYRKCEGSPFVPNPSIPGTERFFIKIDYPKAIDIPRDDPIRLDFDLSSSPLPNNAVDVNLTLVFHGSLGAEFATAVAIGFKDISEPTPIDLFNNTDLVCFSGSYVNYTDPALLQQVDTNHNGVIDCDQGEINIIPAKITPLYLSFNGIKADANNYYYEFPVQKQVAILPGLPYRFYYLTDDNPASTSYSIKVHAENISNSAIPSAGVCPVSFSNDLFSTESYYNKLQWKEGQNKYEHLHSEIGTYRGVDSYRILRYLNVSVPEESTCTASSSGSAQGDPRTTENRAPNKTAVPKDDRITKSTK
jgi:hypothetical protein